MTTTASATNIENFCVTCHPLGEFDDIYLDAPEGADELTSETGWDFKVSIGWVVGEDDDCAEYFILEEVWAKCSLFVELSQALDELIVAANKHAEHAASSRRRATPIWRLHDVRKSGAFGVQMLLK